MKQLIIARKDLNMSPGKLAAQVSHASMVFLTHRVRRAAQKIPDNCNILPVWEYIPLDKTSAQERQELMDAQREWNEKHGRESLPMEILFENDNYRMKRPVLYRHPRLYEWAKEARERGERSFCYKNENGQPMLCAPRYHMQATIDFDMETWTDWINGAFTKVVCEAKNKFQLEKVIGLAANLGLQENIDFFLIKDNCLTELTPEEVDENGMGCTLTCIGFRPLPDDICAQLSKKYQLYK